MNREGTWRGSRSVLWKGEFFGAGWNKGAIRKTRGWIDVHQLIDGLTTVNKLRYVGDRLKFECELDRCEQLRSWPWWIPGRWLFIYCEAPPSGLMSISLGHITAWTSSTINVGRFHHVLGWSESESLGRVFIFLLYVFIQHTMQTNQQYV